MLGHTEVTSVSDLVSAVKGKLASHTKVLTAQKFVSLIENGKAAA